MLTFKKISHPAVSVYLMEMDFAESVAIGVMVNAGARDEVWPKEAGLAHALEHLNLRGTVKFPDGEILNSYIEDVGGNKRANTNKERTFYFGKIPHEHKERLVEVLADVIQNPILSEDRVLTEKGTILREMERRNDAMIPLLYNLTFKFAFKDHPVSHDTLGTIDSVSSFTRNDFVKFREKFYNPANYTLIFAGRINENEARELAEKYFPSSITGKKNIREEIPLIDNAERKYSTYRKTNQLYFSLSAPFVSVKDDRLAKATELFSVMISGGGSFPLSQELREKRGLCYSINNEVIRFSGLGLFHVQAGVDPVQYEKVKGIILEIIEKNKNNSALLEKAKRYKLGRWRLAYENTEQILENAVNQIIAYGKPLDYSELEKGVNKITIVDIEEAVNTYLKPDNIREVAIVPEDTSVDI